MAFDVLLLAANSTGYVAPAGPPVAFVAFFSAWRGYGRAKKLERNVIGWTVFCLLLGLLGLAIFWLLTRRDEQRWAFETIPDNRKKDVAPPLPTWEPNWDAVDTSSPAVVASDATASASIGQQEAAP